MKVYLGIDTSCYTTSAALVNEAYEVVGDERIILSVPQGERGLSQSNMVYQHTRNLPQLFEQLAPVLRQGAEIQAIAVTHRPRRRDDSYMPAFLAGWGYARSLAAVLDVPLYVISHQENHLLAVLRETGEIGTQGFFGLHLSGGTTDLLQAVPDGEGLDIQRIGGSSDISAGQFVDRVGVAMGLSFPAGVHLDSLAQTCTASVKGARVFFKDGQISLSGPESQAQRQIAGGDYKAPNMAQWTLATVWNGLAALLDYGQQRGMKRLVAAGGVLANSYLRSQLLQYGRHHSIRIDQAAPVYSADNATGAAFWAASRKEKDL